MGTFIAPFIRLQFTLLFICQFSQQQQTSGDVCILHHPGYIIERARQITKFTSISVGYCLSKCLERRKLCKAVLHHRLTHTNFECTLFGYESPRTDVRLIPQNEPDLGNFNLYEVMDSCENGFNNSWGQWTQWSTCSKPCNLGIKHRSRDCLAETCVGEDWQNNPCGQEQCKLSVVKPLSDSELQSNFARTRFGINQHQYSLKLSRYEPWAQWSPCSATCGIAFKSRVRNCYNCHGQQKETISCGGRPCPYWGVWEQWNPCPEVCSSEVRITGRVCRNGFDCLGTRTRVSTCNSVPCIAERPEPVVNWGEWTHWSPCSVTCGPGGKQRIKQCISGDCGGPETEFVVCDMPPCPPACGWTSWSDWDVCSVTCDNGIRTRSRQCTCGFRFGNECKGLYNDPAICNLGPCSTWSLWAQWSDCSVTCGIGMAKRRRTCNDPDSNCDGSDEETASCGSGTCATWSQWDAWGSCSMSCGQGETTRSRKCSSQGGCRGSSQDRQPCDLGECPFWKAWSPWSACDVSCGTGQIKRTRFCSHVAWLCKEGTGVEVKNCNASKCPTWTEWGSWTPCSQTCGEGQKSKQRQCDKDGICEGIKEENTVCSLQPCPFWNDWSPWSQCSSTCGIGSRKRRRECSFELECQGEATETDECTSESCPVWSEWTEWFACSVTCGDNSTRSRSRDCSVGDQCPGNGTETKYCDVRVCSSWSNWEQWSSCSVTCEKGDSTRQRKCLAGNRNASDCEGFSSESKTCSLSVCPQWSGWEDWSSCSASCGSGTSRRVRKCFADLLQSSNCVGESTEEKTCIEICSSWSDWQQWSDCNATCGAATKIRLRVCNGSDCPGEAKEVMSCQIHPCPQWLPWSPWTSCSVSCGSGGRFRIRECSQEDYCTGLKSENQQCGTSICPSWEKWLSWSTCSVTCGQGRKQRYRECHSETNSITDCPGNAKELSDCDRPACTSDAPTIPSWTEWSPWSFCTVTCGTGEQSRRRQCLDAKRCNGNETGVKPCITGACAIWDPWHSWGRCSTQCGTGLRTRIRTCSNPGGCNGTAILSETTGCVVSLSCASWLEWDPWSTCSFTCGSGIKTRLRKCSEGSGNCVGIGAQKLNCTTGPCASWLMWSPWSPCSVTCGRGKRLRERSCTHGILCHGHNSELEKCQFNPCPLSPGSVFFVPSPPPSHFPRAPPGFPPDFLPRSRQLPQNSILLPNPHSPRFSLGSGAQPPARRFPTKTKVPPCQWSKWSLWSQCSVSCGDGEKLRTRKCACRTASGLPKVEPGKCLGAPKTFTWCRGSDTRCESAAGEFLLGVWQVWSSWSTCSSTCGRGKKSRVRVCNQERCAGISAQQTFCTLRTSCG